jgi:hypothetical protein
MSHKLWAKFRKLPSACGRLIGQRRLHHRFDPGLSGGLRGGPLARRPVCSHPGQPGNVGQDGGPDSRHLGAVGSGGPHGGWRLSRGDAPHRSRARCGAAHLLLSKPHHRIVSPLEWPVGQTLGLASRTHSRAIVFRGLHDLVRAAPLVRAREFVFAKGFLGWARSATDHSRICWSLRSALLGFREEVRGQS